MLADQSSIQCPIRLLAVVLQRCSIDIFVFRFALVIFDLVICSAYWVLVFFFFFFFLRICWFALLVYHLLGCFFLRLGLLYV